MRRLPIADCLFPSRCGGRRDDVGIGPYGRVCSLFPVPCSLFPRRCGVRRADVGIGPYGRVCSLFPVPCSLVGAGYGGR